MAERTYPYYQPDQSGKHPADLGGAYRYVLCLGYEPMQPLIVHRSNGQAFHMLYRGERGAREALRKVRDETTWATSELGIYDKETGVLMAM